MIRWNLPAYQRAMSVYVDQVVSGFVQHDPLIGDIHYRKTIHSGPTRNVPGPDPIDHPLSELQHDVIVQRDMIRTSDLEEFSSLMFQIANAFREQSAQLFIKRVQDITAATENEFDMEGRPLSVEMVLDIIERLAIEFDEDGHPIMPVLACSPETALQLAKLEPTEEQEQQLEDFVRRRKAEHDAQKRTRRLSE